MRLIDRDIVCIGSADWSAPLPTNQQQLMRRLAEHNRVLFVESLGLRRPQLATHDLRRMWRRLLRGLARPRPDGGVHVLAPLVLPFHGSTLARSINRRLLSRRVRRAVRRLGLRDPILWAYVPQAEVLVEVLEPSLVVYHCVDDVAAQKGVHGGSFREAEKRFAVAADLVLASAPALAERMRTLSSNVLYAPNVADTSLFATALDPGPVESEIAALPRPRMVFQGAVVATKLDIGLLVEVARLRRQWSIVLVGPEGAGDPGGDLSALKAAPNIHLLGVRDPTVLPRILRGGDVGLIPYAVNELTRSVFPMKVYEYLAAGLPVVTTPLPALDGVDGVNVASDAQGTVEAIERELNSDSIERRVARSGVAAGHSWEARVAEIEVALG